MLLTTAVNQAVTEMTWLSGTDIAIAALAKRYAADIERLTRGPVQTPCPHCGGMVPVPVDTSKVLKLLGPELAAALRDLGGTPAQRKELGVESKVKGRLAEIRASRTA